MMRPVPEWIGATDATRAPNRVRARIFDREGGKCHLCGQAIEGKKWDLDHRIALINGGENRESTLLPAHQSCHKSKTATDVAEKAKIAAIHGKHIGAVRPAGKIKSAPFPTKPERPSKARLDYRSLYERIPS